VPMNVTSSHRILYRESRCQQIPTRAATASLRSKASHTTLRLNSGSMAACLHCGSFPSLGSRYRYDTLWKHSISVMVLLCQSSNFSAFTPLHYSDFCPSSAFVTSALYQILDAHNAMQSARAAPFVFTSCWRCSYKAEKQRKGKSRDSKAAKTKSNQNHSNGTTAQYQKSFPALFLRCSIIQTVKKERTTSGTCGRTPGHAHHRPACSCHGSASCPHHTHTRG
jgi:hypothetical protein